MKQSGWTDVQEKETKKERKENRKKWDDRIQYRPLSHLALVWIVRYCYSCETSGSMVPWATCKSWMTVKKADDKLMGFSGYATNHFEGSCADMHTVYLLTFTTSSRRIFWVVFLFYFLLHANTQKQQQRKRKGTFHLTGIINPFSVKWCW